ncbi:MAG: TIGR03985 family CRISPR-associated protein [Oscillatoria sp. SIO1A7]|nr:TIGR03985 family CRISPR-associated protein [Oscillatoria sp. SIO1A7]
MNEQNELFGDRPTIELLQWLARGSLKQNLERAVRLWVWLRCLYGDLGENLSLSDPFTYPQWRDAFFTGDLHQQWQKTPPLHDPNCPCALTIADWLFNRDTGLPEKEWLESLEQHASVPKNISQLLQRRLFAITPRSLSNDLQILVKLGWLNRREKAYERVKDWPARPKTEKQIRPSASLTAYELNFLSHPDLAAIADNFSSIIKGTQRFFLQVDYVLPDSKVDRVDDLQAQLREIWEKDPVPCLLLRYQSPKFPQVASCIVYPVCIYYVQRAVYLVAWGQTPAGEADWRNYRLERIKGEFVSLDWTDPQIPEFLLRRHRQGTLPSPDYIQEQMADAWGFDFYQPASPMLLRFDRLYHRGYIKGTVRHETFQQISSRQAIHMIEQLDRPEEKQMLLNIVSSHSEDAYYTASYRERDPNVIQRLVAWRYHVEVLLPGKLRQAIANDIYKTWELYRN